MRTLDTAAHVGGITHEHRRKRRTPSRWSSVEARFAAPGSAPEQQRRAPRNIYAPPPEGPVQGPVVDVTAIEPIVADGAWNEIRQGGSAQVDCAHYARDMAADAARMRKRETCMMCDWLEGETRRRRRETEGKVSVGTIRISSQVHDVFYFASASRRDHGPSY